MTNFSDVPAMPRVRPRRKDGPSMAVILARAPYNAAKDPFFESNRDFMENNEDAVLWFLENQAAVRRARRIAKAVERAMKPREKTTIDG